MKTVKELTCIGCPMGCPLRVELADGRITDISGYTCKVGKTYAEKECLCPERMVSSTVRVKNGRLRMLSVRTEKPVPKGRIFDCVAALKNLNVEAPVHMGDVIVRDAAGTGVNIIATKNIEKGN